MRIKEFFIKRYGPLQEMSYTLSHPFSLIVGRNEDGKTLTIDALVKLLLGRNVRDFGRTIDRVEENTEGFVVIEGDDGEEIKLPEQGDLTAVAAVTASECRNIFIIRDSDLSIARESEFYTTVTNRLTGLRTEEILRTKEALREIGRITPTGIFRDTKDDMLKTRIEEAQALLENIEGLTQEMRGEKFDELEAEAVRLQEEIEGIELELERLEDARKQETHKKGKEALTRLITARENGNKVKLYTETDAQLWRDCERDIQQRGKEREQSVAKLKGNEEEFKETEKILQEKVRDFRIFEDRKKGLDEVKAELNLYEMKRREGIEREQRASAYMWMGIIASFLLGISLIGLTLRPSLPFYIAAPVFFLTAVFLLTPHFQQARDKAWLAGAFERIKVALTKFESSAETVDQIYAYLQQFEEAHHARGDEIQEITRRKENLEESITELRNKAIPGEENKINDAQGLIDDIRKKSGAESWQVYQQGLKSRQQYEKSLDEERSILRNLLGVKGETVEENIAFWHQKLKTLETDRQPVKNITYNEAAVNQLKEAKDTAEATLDSFHDSMAAFRKRLEEIEREANKILLSETEYLHCTTSIDLEAVRDKLHAFVGSTEGTRDAVLKVMDIFEEIEAEEREKVAELFGTESPISHYFSEITDGLYEAVLFNQRSGQVEVRRKDGVILGAEKLSGGAYDQLYLAIRIALGEKVLQGTKGFFIMDDPFVKADPSRLQKQIEVLQRIAQLGWQILYFSAKAEMRDALKASIKRGAVSYLEIQGIFS
jgi:exonuclease SbcC